MNTVVCSHPDKQMANNSADGLQWIEEIYEVGMQMTNEMDDAGMVEGFEMMPDTHMTPTGPKPAASHNRQPTNPPPDGEYYEDYAQGPATS